jgi:hypothetical protein
VSPQQRKAVLTPERFPIVHDKGRHAERAGRESVVQISLMAVRGRRRAERLYETVPRRNIGMAEISKIAVSLRGAAFAEAFGETGFARRRGRHFTGHTPRSRRVVPSGLIDDRTRPAFNCL